MQSNREGIMEQMDLGDERDGSTVFSGAKMRETNLSGSRAVYADFSNADLTGVVIKDADLRAVNFEGANLTKTDFSGSDMRDTQLKDAIMESAVFENTEQTTKIESKIEAAPERKDMKLILDEKGISLEEMIKEHVLWLTTQGNSGEKMNLSGVDLTGLPDLKKSPITAIKALDSKFIGMNLEDAQMQFCQFDKSDFRDTRMARADLRGSRFINVDFTRADLSDAKLSPLKFKNADGSDRLERVNLSGAVLKHTNLSGADLRNTIFMGADLSNANLSGADLRYADFTGANLKNANLKDADTENAVFQDTQMMS